MPIYKTDKKNKQGVYIYRVVVSYKASDGKFKKVERRVTGMTEAKAKERELEEEFIKLPQQTGSKVMTVNDLFEKYAEDHKNETRATSHDKTVATLTSRVLPFVGNVYLHKLNKQVLQDWKNKIYSLDIALVTKKNAYTSFNAMLNYAVKMEFITTNQLKVLGTFKNSGQTLEAAQGKLRYYTSEQFHKFISQVHQYAVEKDTIVDWGYYVFFNIAFYTGARKGEIYALRWSDIEGDIMHIRRSICQKLKCGDLETLPKNESSIRDVRMPKHLVDMLSEHKERQKTSRFFTEEYRICGNADKPLRDTTIDKKNRMFANMAGLEHIRIHDFRHSHASLLANAGINIQEIARRLGHSDVEMTWSIYSHMYPREEDRALKVLDDIFEEYDA